MKTGEKFYFVSECGNGFEKGDVIEKRNSLTFGLLEEDSIFMLYGTLFTPAKRKLKNDPKVVLIEVSYDIREQSKDESNLDYVSVITVIEDNIRYENAVELVSDFEEAEFVS